MKEVIELNIWQFALIYLLLIVVALIMKRSKVKQTKLLIIASVRMTVQLVLAGLILSYILDNPHPIFTLIYIGAMVVFSIVRVLGKNKWLNKKFKWAVGLSIVFSGLAVVAYFIGVVIGVDLLNPQYAIPISGMIFGNAITGLTLGLKTFRESLEGNRGRTDALLTIGVTPKKILRPYVNTALETALLPTLNSMVGMGIIFLPGMMTGQILAGTFPMTAIMYQVAVMIAICASVCLTVFCALNFGYRTLYNDRSQMTY